MPSLVPHLLLFSAMVVQVVVPPLPAEVIVIAAGRSQGAWTAALVAWALLHRRGTRRKR